MADVLCIGHAVEDHVFSVDALPTKAVKHQARGFTVVGGGPAANAAVAIARLGGGARLAARVGADTVGASIVRDLEAEGVDCALVRRHDGARSSCSAVMVDGEGRRMIVNYLDPAMPSDPTWLLDGFPDDIDVVLADTRWPQGASAGLARAKALGKPGVLDADHPVPHDGGLLEAASHVAFSADGLKAFVGHDDLASALTAVRDRLGVWCCVTDGANGVFIAHTDADARIVHAPCPQITAVDTLGAGDVWHGAFALAVGEGFSTRAAVDVASAAAAIKCTRPGGRAGAPTRTELDTFINANTEEARA